MVAFLLVASFGILFAGCTPKEKEVDEFTFTEEDVARFRELASDADISSGTGAEINLTASGVSSVPVLDLSLKPTYDLLRTGVAAGGENVYTVTNDVLNVRAEARTNAANLETLRRGDSVSMIEFTDAAWAKIKTASGKEGFVAHRYIAKPTSEEKLGDEKKKFENMYFVDFGFLNVRKGPDAQSEKIGELPGQSFVKPLTIDSEWAKVPFNGQEGYVSSSYLSPFLPNFLVRQDTFTLPIVHYRLTDPALLAELPKQLDALKAAGIRIITLRSFYDLLLQQQERDVRVDPNTIVLAISDVDAESMAEVSDILRASGVVATVFIPTRNLGLTGITEKNVLTYMANGLDLQSGTHMGEDLRSLTNAQVELELKQSRQLLNQYTRKEIYAVSFPRGGVNDRVMQKAAEAGYLFGISSGKSRTFSRSEFLKAPSLVVTAGMTNEEIIKFVKGED